MTTDETMKQSPPDVSYKTFDRFLSSLQEHLPKRIDHNYWGELFSFRVGTQLMSAMRFLNMIDVNASPRPRLNLLMSGITGEHRAALLRQVADESYGFVFKNSIDTQTANYDELEAVFQHSYRMEKDVCRKCIQFFIEFSKDAGIPLSPEITKKRKIPRSSPGIKNSNKNLDIMSNIPIGIASPIGEYLKGELVVRNLSQQELSNRMGKPLNEITDIINGKKTINAETALQLEELMPTFPARFWLYLQSDFQLTEALAAKRLAYHQRDA